MDAWAGWGDPSRRPGVPRHALGFLSRRLGVLTPTTAADLGAARLRPSALDADVAARLGALVGPGHVRTDDESRARHSGGQSYLDLLRRRAGDASDAPDAVVLPGDADEVLAVLALCADARIAVVPFGGGTSVVGGVNPLRESYPCVVTLDLSRLDALLTVDEKSLLATFQPGVTGPDAERLLAPYRLTLGHFPQSWERASVGGFVATRSAGQASTGYGRIDRNVVGLRLATPRGELAVPALPSTAAGPDLRALVVGSEGIFGVLTEVTLRVHARPVASRYEGWAFRSLDAGLAALRALAQSGVAATVVRLSDPDETAANLTLAGGLKVRALRAYLRTRGYGDGCLVVVGQEGTAEQVRSRSKAAAAVLRDGGGLSLGTGPGQAWAHGRYTGPYLRDDLMDAGVLVETLETVTTWTRLPALRTAVVAALRSSLGERAVIMAHVSHIYAEGASLYVTVLAAADTDPAAQWRAAKRAASEAIVAQGASITHHHAVGTDHAPYLAAQIGELGLEVLRAVKDVLDPTGICNPGKLLPR